MPPIQRFSRPSGAGLRRAWRWVFATLIAGALPAVAEGQLQAGPTLIELRGEAGATRLTLSNPGQAEVAAQVRVYRWLQVDGADQLIETDDVGVSPPIVQVPPGAEQLVRLVRLGSPPDSADVAYRVVVEELPPPGPPASGRVEMRMRYLIPFFDRWAGSSPPDLDCGWVDDGAALVCTNRGDRPAQLGATRLVSSDGSEVVLSEGLFGYVLPRSTRRWPVDGPLRAAPAALDTRLNGRPLTVAVGGG